MSSVSKFARSTDPDTSHQAAQDAKAHAPSDRDLVLLTHYEHLNSGLTDYELAAIVGRLQTSMGTRRADLMKPSRGHVSEPLVDEMLDEAGEPMKGRTPSGSACKAWQITDAGIAVAETILRARAA